MKKLIMIAMAMMLTVTVGCLDGPGGDSPKKKDNPAPYVPPSEPDTLPEAADLPGTYHDTEKQFTDDTMMCWAITACNMLAYHGYVSDGNVCMSYMTDHFYDQAGQISNGLVFYLEDVYNLSSKSTNSRIDAVTYGYDVPFFIMESITAGNPVGLGMFSYVNGLNYGHAITAYGYEYYPDEGRFEVFITDGDDRANQMVTLSLYDNGAEWVALGAYLVDYNTSHAISLAAYDGEYSLERTLDGAKLKPMAKGK